MKILVTNDDGILSEGLWTLVAELKKIAQVYVVAPDREQSATGTSVTLRQSLKAQAIKPVIPDVEAFAVEGTPSDSVILGMGKLIKDRVDLVISGINQGLNLGEDVHISGTVGAALQGYLRGCPALAISALYDNGQRPETAARIAALLASRIMAEPRLSHVFLNINLPGPTLNGIQLTRLASRTHVNTVDEGNHGWHSYYWLVRHRTQAATEKGTDVAAIEQGKGSITPLYPNGDGKAPMLLLNRLCNNIYKELASNEEGVRQIAP